VITVLVSVGTDHHPFTRLLDWAAEVQSRIDATVVVQRGATPARPDLESFDYLPAEQLAERMQTADAVVCHGGPGTIDLCRSAGHRAIVVARDPAHGEHVDDHQIRYSTKLANDSEIDLATTCDEMIRLLSLPRPALLDDNRLSAARSADRFAELADQLLDGELERRRWKDRFLFRRTR